MNNFLLIIVFQDEPEFSLNRPRAGNPVVFDEILKPLVVYVGEILDDPDLGDPGGHLGVRGGGGELSVSDDHIPVFSASEANDERGRKGAFPTTEFVAVFNDSLHVWQLLQAEPTLRHYLSQDGSNDPVPDC